MRLPPQRVYTHGAYDRSAAASICTGASSCSATWAQHFWRDYKRATAAYLHLLPADPPTTARVTLAVLLSYLIKTSIAVQQVRLSGHIATIAPTPFATSDVAS